MKSLSETLKISGKNIESVASYIQQFCDENYQQIWDEALPRTREIYENSGEPAYGFFARTLFQPLTEELQQAGLSVHPDLPGSFAWSWEEWGPQSYRERRLASTISRENGEPLGTLITRFFHDHTQLRLPQAPIIVPLKETARDAIEQAALNIR